MKRVRIELQMTGDQAEAIASAERRGITVATLLRMVAIEAANTNITPASRN